MELLVLAGALVAFDVAAYFFGHDSRDASAVERKMLKDSWPGF
jgi:hypothetical protein